MLEGYAAADPGRRTQYCDIGGCIIHLVNKKILLCHSTVHVTSSIGTCHAELPCARSYLHPDSMQLSSWGRYQLLQMHPGELPNLGAQHRCQSAGGIHHFAVTIKHHQLLGVCQALYVKHLRNRSKAAISRRDSALRLLSQCSVFQASKRSQMRQTNTVWLQGWLALDDAMRCQ